MVDENKDMTVEKASGYKRQMGMLRRAAEQVFVDESIETGLKDNLQTVFDKDAPVRFRSAAALGIVSHFLPTSVRSEIRKRLDYSQDEMPFNPEDYELMNKLNYGGANDVFLLESRTGKDSYVLKVLIDVIGTDDVDSLVAMAANQKEDYEFVSSKFEDVPGLVPPEYFIVTHGPRGGTPAIVTIQPFIGGNVRDIFELERSELLKIVDRNEVFRDQLTGFNQVLSQNKSLIDEELDLMGRCNLAVVGDEGEERLLLLDAHSRPPEVRADYFRDEIQRRVDYIHDLTNPPDTVR